MSKVLRFIPFSSDAQPAIRGRCPSNLPAAMSAGGQMFPVPPTGFGIDQYVIWCVWKANYATTSLI